MKTLIFNGSPRKNGDTASLLRLLTAQLEGAYHIVNAYECGIAPCVDCRWCCSHSGCAIDDGMTALFAEIAACDNLLIASPVYFTALTGPLLSLASRLQSFFCNQRFLGQPPQLREKRGAVLLVGGGSGAPTHADLTARCLLRLMHATELLPLVGSFHTDRVPAVEDPAAIAGLREIAAFFNGRRDG